MCRLLGEMLGDRCGRVKRRGCSTPSSASGRIAKAGARADGTRSARREPLRALPLDMAVPSRAPFLGKFS